MNNVVQMHKKRLIQSWPNVIQLPKFFQILNVRDTFQKRKNNRVIKFLDF